MTTPTMPHVRSRRPHPRLGLLRSACSFLDDAATITRSLPLSPHPPHLRTPGTLRYPQPRSAPKSHTRTSSNSPDEPLAPHARGAQSASPKRPRARRTRCPAGHMPKLASKRRAMTCQEYCRMGMSTRCVRTTTTERKQRDCPEACCSRFVLCRTRPTRREPCQAPNATIVPDHVGSSRSRRNIAS